MKIKLIALAAAALVAGAANANIIDGGSTSGNGGLLFAAWDGQTSFALNTGLTIDSLIAAVSSGTGYSFTDSAWTNWLSTANTANVTWTIFANDQLGAQRGITTTDGSNAGVTMNNPNARAANSARSFFIDQQLNLGAFGTAGVTESIVSVSSAAYPGTSALGFGNDGYSYNFNSNGSLSNSDYASGLGVISINTANGLASGKATYASLSYNGTAAHAWIDSTGTFNIGTVAAVPEPESIAMLLAGIGMIGSIARRRNRAA